jgi:hypothetical protein
MILESHSNRPEPRKYLPNVHEEIKTRVTVDQSKTIAGIIVRQWVLGVVQTKGTLPTVSIFRFRLLNAIVLTSQSILYA